MGVYSQGHGRKTDADDMVSIVLAALKSDGVVAVHADDTLVSLRLLCDRRDDGDALAVEINRFRQIYNTIRPHQAIADRTPRDAYLARS